MTPHLPWSVGRSVIISIISQKSGNFHFHAPIGALVDKRMADIFTRGIKFVMPKLLIYSVTETKLVGDFIRGD